jgi:hypothetical protein
MYAAPPANKAVASICRAPIRATLVLHEPVGLDLFRDYLEHGRTFPNQRAYAGS